MADGGSLSARLKRTFRHRRVAAGLWLQQTPNLIRLSVLVFVPLTIAVVTWLANVSNAVSFLLYPPLAAGTYSLFARPDAASPRRFVTGITVGAICGWLAVIITSSTGIGIVEGPIRPSEAALSVLLVAVVTLLFRIEEASAYSTALLVLATGVGEVTYVLGIGTSSLVVAGMFILWRDRVYDRRLTYLYRSTDNSSPVLVPLWTGIDISRLHFGAQLATQASPETLVLLAIAADEESEDAPEIVEHIEEHARSLEAEYGITCEVVVVTAGDPVTRTLTVADEMGCEPIVAPFDRTTVSTLEGLFRGEHDVVGLYTTGDRTTWNRSLVGIKTANQIGRRLVSLATTISGQVSLAHCLSDRERRQTAEAMLDELIGTYQQPIDIRVTTAPPEAFFKTATRGYDLLLVGASTDRTAMSRALTPPMYYDIDAKCDIAVVHRTEQ